MIPVDGTSDHHEEAADRGPSGDADRGTPGAGVTPTAREIAPAAPEEFGLIQVWWGDGKGKTTAALGMGMRAAGHGYRVHLLQFMKGGADSVEPDRGEYNAIAALPGMSYENTGHYGWHGFRDGSADDDHAAKAAGGLARARELIDAAADADLTDPLPLAGDPADGVHLLILDEILYAADKGLIDAADVRELIEAKPADLELVVTGSHTRPDYLEDDVDLMTRVGKEKHPIDAGIRARKGTEF